MTNTDFKITRSQDYKGTNQHIKISGVYLTNDNTNLQYLNITSQLTRIDNLISIWRLQGMTPYRCITIVKMFLISQFIYTLTLLPTVKVNTKELQNKLDNFV